MLVLALVAWLAASAPDAVTPIPGTKLRLGMSEAQLADLGAFPEVKAPDAAGTTPRQGQVKFFGLACQATLYFRDGFLARAHFEASGVSPNTQDYVEDQLRRAKLMRECTRFAPGDHACDWLNEGVKVHLEIQKDRVDARVEPPPRPWEAEPDSAPPAVATNVPAAGSTPPAPSATAPGSTPRGTVAAPKPAQAAPAPAPGGAAAAPKPAPATPSPSPSTSPPATPPSAAASPPAVPPPHAADPVATLPETLRISLPERNAPSEWPRITSAPKLVYPDAARRESVQGIVWVLALVDTDGTVRNATIDRGIRELNDAAVAWLSKARFAPCVRDGRPCRFWVRVAARFTLY